MPTWYWQIWDKFRIIPASNPMMTEDSNNEMECEKHNVHTNQISHSLIKRCVCMFRKWRTYCNVIYAKFLNDMLMRNLFSFPKLEKILFCKLKLMVTSNFQSSISWRHVPVRSLATVLVYVLKCIRKKSRILLSSNNYHTARWCMTFKKLPANWYLNWR